MSEVVVFERPIYCCGEGIIGNHHHYHAVYMNEIPNEIRDLDCEICSGLPPWQWSQSPVHVEIIPYNKRDNRRGRFEYSDIHGRTALRDAPKKYVVLMGGNFGWRMDRVWRFIDPLIGKCRVCSRWARVARHKVLEGPGVKWDDRGTDAWEKKHVCLKCIRKENKATAKLNQHKEIKRLIRELKKMAKGA